jgi:hypothetical protein
MPQPPQLELETGVAAEKTKPDAAHSAPAANFFFFRVPI